MLQPKWVGAPNVKVKLLGDSRATGGALSTVRVSLEAGADGAKPHHHTKSWEMFYVLDGPLEVLSGHEIVRAEDGDVIVVPPRMAHAFAAERGSNAELLIIIAPGVERLEHFRTLARIARGEESRTVSKTYKICTITISQTAPNGNMLVSLRAPEAAQYILTLEFKDSDKERMNDLAEKAREGALSSGEEQELENYRHVGHLLALLRSKTRISLNQRDTV